MHSTRAERIRSTMFTLAAAVALSGLFGPWLRSGASARSSFELLDLVERLGFTSGGVFEWAVRGWPLVPLLTVAALVACWAGRSRWAVGLGLVSSLYISGCALAVANAPDAGLVRTGWGVDVSLAGGVGLLTISVWIAATPMRGAPEIALDEHVAQ